MKTIITILILGCAFKFFSYWEKKEESKENAGDNYINDTAYQSACSAQKKFGIICVSLMLFGILSSSIKNTFHAIAILAFFVLIYYFAYLYSTRKTTNIDEDEKERKCKLLARRRKQSLVFLLFCATTAGLGDLLYDSGYVMYTMRHAAEVAAIEEEKKDPNAKNITSHLESKGDDYANVTVEFDLILSKETNSGVRVRRHAKVVKENGEWVSHGGPIETLGGFGEEADAINRGIQKGAEERKGKK